MSDEAPSGPDVPAILAARDVTRARLAPTGKDLEHLLLKLHKQSAIAQKNARESHAKLRAEPHRRLEQGQTLEIHGNEVVVSVVTTRERIGAMEADSNEVKVEAMAQRDGRAPDAHARGPPAGREHRRVHRTPRAGRGHRTARRARRGKAGADSRCLIQAVMWYGSDLSRRLRYLALHSQPTRQAMRAYVRSQPVDVIAVGPKPMSGDSSPIWDWMENDPTAFVRVHGDDAHREVLVYRVVRGPGLSTR